MFVVSKTAVKNYLKGFTGRNQSLHNLLLGCLYLPLLNDKRFMTCINDPDQIQNKKLREQFQKSAEPLYMFTPSPELDEKVDKITMWIFDFLGKIRDDYSGAVKSAVTKKMRSISSLDEAYNLALKSEPLVTPKEYENALSTRLESNEEKQGHIKLVACLSNRHNFFQIMTPRGMHNAGQKAQNCLGSKKHRRMVQRPNHYLYFTIRDPDNNSVSTIAVDLHRNSISTEANKGKDGHPLSYTDAQYDIVLEAMEVVRQNHPQLKKDRPYGTYGTYQQEI